MQGSCLCGAVTFTLLVNPKHFYRCHCSLCRKQTGVGFNLATLVKVEDFQWGSGEKSTGSWLKPSGYRTDFCTVCGSTVPNILRGSPYVWIPLGLIDTPREMTCVADYCTDDAMPWDNTRSGNSHASAVESLATLLVALDVN